MLVFGIWDKVSLLFLVNSCDLLYLDIALLSRCLLVFGIITLSSSIWCEIHVTSCIFGYQFYLTQKFGSASIWLCCKNLDQHLGGYNLFLRNIAGSSMPIFSSLTDWISNLRKGFEKFCVTKSFPN